MQLCAGCATRISPRRDYCWRCRNPRCGVCLEPVTEEPALACGHRLHAPCVALLRKSGHLLCPICRAPLGDEEEEPPWTPPYGQEGAEAAGARPRRPRSASDAARELIAAAQSY